MKLKLINHRTQDTATCLSVASTALPTTVINKTPQIHTAVMKFKKNTASILRTGAFVTKAIKANESMVNDLMSGGSNPCHHRLHVQNAIRESHERKVEEIERRHLLGLISWEEAKVAKIEVMKAKQKAANELKWERSQLRNVIKSELEKSVSKSKAVVRKIHMGRLMSKKTKFDLNNSRKIEVENLKNFNKKLLREMEEAKAAETQRKLELVQKIKAKKENFKNLPNEKFLLDIDEV